LTIIGDAVSSLPFSASNVFYFLGRVDTVWVGSANAERTLDCDLRIAKAAFGNILGLLVLLELQECFADASDVFL